MAAGFINTIAGGGSSLTLPILIFLGLEPAVANGTNRIAILFQNVSAVSSFKKQNIADIKTSIYLSLYTLPGAIIGSIAAIKIESAMFNKILGLVLIFIMISMFLPKSKNTIEKSNVFNWKVITSMTFIGFYGGFIQVGVGFFLMTVLYIFINNNLLYVNMYKVFIVLVYTIPSIIIFLIAGKIEWQIGFILSLGNALGAWWSVKYSVKKGEKVIKYALTLIIIFVSLKLFGIINI